MSGGIHRRRLEALEEMARAHRPGTSTEARARMSEQLSRLAAARRGELDAEEEAEVRYFWAAFERRAAEARGEGA